MTEIIVYRSPVEAAFWSMVSSDPLRMFAIVGWVVLAGRVAARHLLRLLGGGARGGLAHLV